MNEKRNFPLGEGRDPRLMQLFHESEHTHDDDAFVDVVMMRARKLRRRRSIVLLIGCVAALPAAWVLSAPFNDLAQALHGFVAQPIVDVGSSIGAPLIAPLNSVGSAVAIAALGLYAAYRRLFA